MERYLRTTKELRMLTFEAMVKSVHTERQALLRQIRRLLEEANKQISDFASLCVRALAYSERASGKIE